VSWIDTSVLASTLVVLAFAGVGFFAWRSGSQRTLDAGPFWYWAWATVLVAGAAADLAETTLVGAYVPPVLSPVFSALLVAGALRYCGRSVPVFLLPAGIGVGCVRALAEGVGLPVVSGTLSLAVEPTGALVAGWLVHREASAERASWPHRAMPFGFVAIAAVEALGAAQSLGGAGRLIVWPLWLAAGIPLVGLQAVTGMERAARAEKESQRDRERREAANHRLELVAGNIQEVICELSADGELLWISDSFRDALGLDPAELVGRNYRDFLARFEVADAHGEDAAAVLGDLASMQAGSEQSQVRSRIHSIRDGRGRVRYLETRTAREAAGDGEPRLLAFSRDVTDRMAAQRAIRSSEARFRKFSMLGSDYCYVTTGSIGQPGAKVDNWVTGSLEEISGYSHEELQELGFTGFIHPDDLEAGRERVMNLLQGGGESSHEFRMVTKSGDIRWIAETLLIERDEDRFTVYGAARDISEQRRLESALSSSQKLESLGMLAGGIAHDFNNLLMVILGNTEMALDSPSTSTAVRQDLEGVVDAVEQAQTLTQQLLAYAGRGAVQQVPVDLSERVRSVSELLAAAGAADVSLELDLKEGLPAVVADPGEIQQLTMNLVLNAIEACEGAGCVRVAARPLGDDERTAADWAVGTVRDDVPYVVLEVSDDGAGMDADTVERVFDPFFTTKTAGRGLGLAAVIGIVLSVDGAIRVESQPGDGARFSVVLPASSQGAVARAGEQTPEEPVEGHILVVDDDARVRQVAVRILRARGFDVSTASDGAEAVEACRERPFDVILLDAVMPGLSASETFDALRALRPDVPVLMVSGFDMERAAGDLLDRGLAGFVGKPFRARELLARISALIAEGT